MSRIVKITKVIPYSSVIVSALFSDFINNSLLEDTAKTHFYADDALVDTVAPCLNQTITDFEQNQKSYFTK